MFSLFLYQEILAFQVQSRNYLDDDNLNSTGTVNGLSDRYTTNPFVEIGDFDRFTGVGFLGSSLKLLRCLKFDFDSSNGFTTVEGGLAEPDCIIFLNKFFPSLGFLFNL